MDHFQGGVPAYACSIQEGSRGNSKRANFIRWADAMERIKKIRDLWSRRPLASRIWILVFLLFVFTVELRNILKDSPENHSVRIAAKRNLRAGIMLTVHDLTVAFESAGSRSYQLSFSDQELHEVVGCRLLADVSEGSLILRSQLEPKDKINFSRKVPKGQRAFLIKTQSRIPLESGDRIDLHAFQMVFEDKKVLAINKREDHQELLVALSPEEIRKLESLGGSLWVDIVLRNPLDNSKMANPKTKLRTKKVRTIPVWEEGAS
ncbi:MAG: hypothetical protein ACKN9V_02385 [Pseudomonadota bacterium]